MLAVTSFLVWNTGIESHLGEEQWTTIKPEHLFTISRQYLSLMNRRGLTLMVQQIEGLRRRNCLEI